MSVARKPTEGVLNIVRFNWPFFAWSAAGATLLLVFAIFTSSWMALVGLAASFLLILGITISLSVSYFVYDRSDLYRLPFLQELDPEKIVNLTAGFDETTPILQSIFPEADIQTFDFFKQKSHTEPSIKRARALFPQHPGTLPISTSDIPLPDGQCDLVLGFFSLHEIRNESERIRFLSEIKRTLSSNGQLVIVEHLRDLPNFLAYSIGFFHFHSRRTWRRAFQKAHFECTQETNLTPFVKIFQLTRP